MKRVAVAAAVATLALPASALASTFNARVVRSDALTLVLRRVDGRTLRYAANRITSMPTAARGRPQPLAHMAGGPRSAGPGIQALDPGLVVRVTDTGEGTISLGIPSRAGIRHTVTGVVDAVSAGSILLDAPGGLELRLRGPVASLRPCQQATVVYHQDRLALVADRVTPTGRSDCAG